MDNVLNFIQSDISKPRDPVGSKIEKSNILCMHAAGRFHPSSELPIPNPRDAVGSKPHCRCWWWLSWCWVPPPLAATGGGNTTEATGTGDTTPGRHSCPCCPPPHAKCPYSLILSGSTTTTTTCTPTSTMSPAMSGCMRGSTILTR